MIGTKEGVLVWDPPQLAVLGGVEAAGTDITGRSLKAVRDSAIQAYARNNPNTTLRVFIGSKCLRSGNLVGLQPGERRRPRRTMPVSVQYHIVPVRSWNTLMI